MNDLIKRLRGGQLLEDGQRFIPHSDAMKLLSEAAGRIEELEDDIAAIQRVAEKYQDEAGKSVARMDEMADEIQFLTWHSELCRDDARKFYEGRKEAQARVQELARELTAQKPTGFAMNWGRPCAKCGEPVYPPSNRYMAPATCLGDKIWHGHCVTGVSVTF